jgi:peptidoglycan/LPS O-acetylase OafA/YrhL
MQNVISSKRRFAALDSWRGVCAIMVAVHNFEYPQAPFIKHSSLFVDFFFVLSGFVITHSYRSRLNTGADFRAFILRRFGRLWPLHMALLIVFVGLDVIRLVLAPLMHADFNVPQFTSPNSISAIIQNVFLVQAVGIHTDLSWNVPSWSISTEFWTYILFALLYFMTTTREPSVILVCSVVVASGLVMFYLSPNYLEANSYCALLRCIYGFLFGHLIYKASEINRHQIRAGTALEMLAVVFAVTFVYFSDGPSSIVAPIVFGFAVWAFSQESGAVSRLLQTRWPANLGTWSYSIYMVHWLIRNSISSIAKIAAALTGYPIAIHVPWNGQDSVWTMNAVFTGYLVAVIVTASWSYKLIEQPARRYFNQIAERGV